jgi:phage terminase Nu1 subunit (DNA packaging protein)
MNKTLCEVFMAEEQRKLHEPVLDHNGKPFSPAQILALERAELTRIRVMRDAMILAERREQLIEMDVVARQAAAIFAAVRQKLLLIPHTLSHRLVGKDHKTIHEAITAELHKALREMADFDQKVIKPNWQPGSTEDPFRQTTRPLPKARPVVRRKKHEA